MYHTYPKYQDTDYTGNQYVWQEMFNRKKTPSSYSKMMMR